MLETKPRQPLKAALMSLVLPGFGQLYNGEINKAIWLFLGFALLSVPGMALVSLYLPDRLMMPALLLSVALTLGLWIYGVIDGWRQAKFLHEYIPESWQLSGVYCLILLLCNGVVLPLLIGFVRAHQVEPFRIPSSSMEPSVLQGDYLFADKRYNCPGCKSAIRRGDIAIFTYPNDRTQLYIKRIVALAGDRVEIHGETIRVNGVALSTRPNEEHEDGHQWHSRFDPSTLPLPDVDAIVPAGNVFVLGDNRSASTDSRKFGTVPMQDVVGKAKQVWFSHGKDGVRWSRLGQVL